MEISLSYIFHPVISPSPRAFKFILIKVHSRPLLGLGRRGHPGDSEPHDRMNAGRCMKQGTQSQCTGTTQRDGMGRGLGGGFMMGDTCTPMADSCQYTAKKHYNIIISLQFLKINFFKLQ